MRPALYDSSPFTGGRGIGRVPETATPEDLDIDALTSVRRADRDDLATEDWRPAVVEAAHAQPDDSEAVEFWSRSNGRRRWRR